MDGQGALKGARMPLLLLLNLLVEPRDLSLLVLDSHAARLILAGARFLNDPRRRCISCTARNNCRMLLACWARARSMSLAGRSRFTYSQASTRASAALAILLIAVIQLLFWLFTFNLQASHSRRPSTGSVRQWLQRPNRLR